MILLFLLSIIIISKGADWFIDSAVSISSKCGIPQIVVGATIVSFATVAPEFLVSVIAVYLGHTELAVGNAVGSVICNTGLVMGFVLAVSSVSTFDRGFFVKCSFMMSSALVFLLFAYNGTITQLNGFFLLLIFFTFIYYNHRQQNTIWGKDSTSSRKEMMRDIKSEVFYFTIGAVFVIVGSRLLIYSGVEIATIIGIPEIIIGLTLVAFGTSVPELVTAIASIVKKHQELSIGNIIGANIMGITLIFGVAPFIRDIPILSQSLYYDIPVMLGLMVIVILPALVYRRLNRLTGILMLGTYVAYIIGLFVWYM